MYFCSAPRSSSQCLFICNDIGGAESPNEEAQPNEASLYSGHWWSSDMTVDQTPVLPLKSFGTVVDSSGSLI